MFPIDFCHIPVSIIKRSAGRSAVAAAAYRSGTKLTNEWDGMTHDYTRKGGIVHAEIMLPAHAPPEFADRSILWNSVEQIEKARDSQLAREIEAALPRELSGEQQLALVRAYVKDNFVDKGMCADFAIHDKGTGNPHVHIMLTLRPLKENGQWGAKCRKAYDLDENGQRIPDGKGGWKNHREDTTDWNDKGNVEIWRAAWAAYTNRALESAGRPERIDHRSYKRQGIDKIPSVHLGPAASQMEKRGIRTDKGEVNRQIAADNKLLGQFDLVGIPPAPRGMPQIEVTFDIDANGIVNVSAKDKATNKEQAIRIQASGGLSDADIENMVKDAEANAEADKKKKELVEAKNQAESLVHATEKTLKEHGDKVSAAEKSKIEDELKALKTAIEAEDLSVIKEKTESLMQASLKLGEAMYKSQADASAAAGAQPGADAGASADQPAGDDKVVDADFEEVK